MLLRICNRSHHTVRTFAVQRSTRTLSTTPFRLKAPEDRTGPEGAATADGKGEKGYDPKKLTDGLEKTQGDVNPENAPEPTRSTGIKSGSSGSQNDKAQGGAKRETEMKNSTIDGAKQTPHA